MSGGAYFSAPVPAPRPDQAHSTAARRTLESEVGPREICCIEPRYVTGYTVIVGFKHRGLERYFESGDTRGLNPNHAAKVRRILARLQAATSMRDLDAPGFRLHPLRGRRKGQWAVDVDRSWRVTFTFDGHDVDDVNYEDYH